MALKTSVKTRPTRPLAVAVITTDQELDRAARLRQMPDLFELRLDALNGTAEKLVDAIVRLHAPLIITARHPLEGGANNLSAEQRRGLLLHFLPTAKFVDVELRAAKRLHAVLATATTLDVKRVISVHQLRGTPPVSRMQQLLADAEDAGADIFKIATRTDTTEELDRLIAFFDSAESRMPVSAMGIGKLGRRSREMLALRGSVLNYGHLSHATVDGQLSLSEVRSLLRQTTNAKLRS